MESFTINNKIISRELIHQHALDVLQKSYSPYSHFPVGAVLIDEHGNIHVGTNVENASFGLSSCAERNAIFSSIPKGMKKIELIYVIGNTVEAISPCGACRQVIREFSHKNTIIILSNLNKKNIQMSIDELLPYSFGPEHIIKSE